MKLKQTIRRLNIQAHFILLRYFAKKSFRIKFIRPYTGLDFEVTRIYL